jgi:hypothetical protein
MNWNNKEDNYTYLPKGYFYCKSYNLIVVQSL